MKNEEATNEAKPLTAVEMQRGVMCVCPDCGGDGKETCHNPDHGFIGVMGWHEIGRLGCPVCGHDEYHKVPNGGNCETCEGKAEVSEEDAHRFCDGMDYDFELEYLNEEST